MMHSPEATTEEERWKFLEELVDDFCPRPEGDEDDSVYRTAIVLFAAMAYGTGVTRLSEVTGYPKEFIATISLNMREAGIWAEDEVCYEHWFDGDSIRRAPIWCDVMVAQGQLITQRRDDGKFLYSRVRPC
jgi:hypothetical protein